MEMAILIISAITGAISLPLSARLVLGRPDAKGSVGPLVMLGSLVGIFVGVVETVSDSLPGYVLIPVTSLICLAMVLVICAAVMAVPRIYERLRRPKRKEDTDEPESGKFI